MHVFVEICVHKLILRVEYNCTNGGMQVVGIGGGSGTLASSYRASSWHAICQEFEPCPRAAHFFLGGNHLQVHGLVSMAEFTCTRFAQVSYWCPIGTLHNNIIAESRQGSTEAKLIKVTIKS